MAEKPQLPFDKSVILQKIASSAGLNLLILTGSRATAHHTPSSDWDFAFRFADTDNYLQLLAKTELLRQQLAEALQISPLQIDLVDLTNANLAMKAAVAEQGLPVIGEESFCWYQFLEQTWRELEYWYWEKEHAA